MWAPNAPRGPLFPMVPHLYCPSAFSEFPWASGGWTVLISGALTPVPRLTLTALLGPWAAGWSAVGALHHWHEIWGDMPGEERLTLLLLQGELSSCARWGATLRPIQGS